MSGAATGEGSYVYAVSCRRLGLLKIGVADDPGKRLRELQVGSPAELTLAYMQPYAERRDAVAVCEELYRCFAGRRDRGRWYRLTLEEVRHGLARRATVEAPQRARAAEAARESRVAAGRRKRLGGRTEKQLAYERRRRQERTRMQKRAARLLSWMSQEQAAVAVGVTSRTLRNWKAAPAFRRELERSQQRRLRPPTSVRSRRATSPVRRQADDQGRDRAPSPPAQQQPTAEAEEQLPSGFRYVNGVPLWGDSDGWPRTAEEHAQRHGWYSARRDRSEADRYDYNTIVRLGGQTAAEKRAVRQEQKQTRQRARAKRTPARDP
jgi:hypothetical protein